MHWGTPHCPHASQTVPMLPQHSPALPQTLGTCVTQQLAPIPLVHMGPSPGDWPDTAIVQGTQVGLGGHVHAPQVQSDPHVCIPYVLQARVEPGEHPVAPVHAPCATH